MKKHRNYITFYLVTILFLDGIILALLFTGEGGYSAVSIIISLLLMFSAAAGVLFLTTCFTDEKEKILRIRGMLEEILKRSRSASFISEKEDPYDAVIEGMDLAMKRLDYGNRPIRGNGKMEETHLETEKNILLSFISNLPDGVVFCGGKGRIRFSNKRAEEFLSRENGNDHEKPGKTEFEPGTSVFDIIPKNLVEHALDDINEKLKQGIRNASSHFVTEGSNHRILRVQLLPILGTRGAFQGFILVITDITRQIEADNRVDFMLQSLTRNTRSPVAGIRSSIEAILEYPDMDERKRKEFHKIIHKESITLSHLLGKVASEYSGRIKTRWSLFPVSCLDFGETVIRRAKDILGIEVAMESPGGGERIEIDNHTLTTACLFLIQQLRELTGSDAFSIRFLKQNSYIALDIIWSGDALRAEILRKWERESLSIGKDRLPLTLREVLQHHDAEILSFIPKEDENQSFVRMLIPVSERGEEQKGRIMVLPESSPEFYNFDLIHHTGRGIESDSRLLTELTYSVLIREVLESRNIDEIAENHVRLPNIIRRMITSGTKTKKVTWLITTFTDAVIRKLIEFSLKELGSPPVPFAFITMGSEGRGEQTLKTDQDNAIVFDLPGDIENEKHQRIHEHFLEIGTFVCDRLDQAGYNFCTGGVMAKNLRWCQPFSVWKSCFSDWIHAGDPEDLLNASIFFDFRHTWGDQRLVERLKDHLFRQLTGWSGFFRNLTENALHYKPPIGFFRNIQVESRGEHRNMLDIKYAMTPIVDFARIMALSNGIRETNTQERLYSLRTKGVLSQMDYSEIDQAYGFLMQLRFVHQIAAVMDENKSPDNFIDPRKLSSMERKMLKEAFKVCEKIQGRLRFEFLGT